MAGREPRARRLGADMRRREFLSVLTGAVAISSRVARAQQSNEMRRLGILVPANSTDMKFQIQVQAFEQELKKFGWTIGQNVQIETRWATANLADIRKNAAELVALKPDAILAHGSSTVGPLQQVTNTIPIVFPVAGDPVGGSCPLSGVKRTCRPGLRAFRPLLGTNSTLARYRPPSRPPAFTRSLGRCGPRFSRLASDRRRLLGPAALS